MNWSRNAAGLTVLCGLLSACSDTATGEAVATPYDPGQATLVGTEKGGEDLELARACSEYDCGDELDECGDRAAADVIVDADGEVVDVICYKQDVNVDAVPLDQTESAEAGNNTVLVLDDEADGVDVEGDVTISGNNAVLYGEGPDVSVIGGTIEIEKNNAIVRGVRVQQDVTITKNNTQMAFCVIEGDLTISGNNTTVAECTVFGKVTITGLNTVFVQNQFAKADFTGQNLICNGNILFDDADGSMTVESSELGEVLACGSDHPDADADAGVPADPVESDAGTP